MSRGPKPSSAKAADCERRFVWRDDVAAPRAAEHIRAADDHGSEMPASRVIHDAAIEERSWPCVKAA